MVGDGKDERSNGRGERSGLIIFEEYEQRTEKKRRRKGVRTAARRGCRLFFAVVFVKNRKKKEVFSLRGDLKEWRSEG